MGPSACVQTWNSTNLCGMKSISLGLGFTSWPLYAGQRPHRILNRELLPQPFGPVIRRCIPSVTCKHIYRFKTCTVINTLLLIKLKGWHKLFDEQIYFSSLVFEKRIMEWPLKMSAQNMTFWRRLHLRASSSVHSVNYWPATYKSSDAFTRETRLEV